MKVAIDEKFSTRFERRRRTLVRIPARAAINKFSPRSTESSGSSHLLLTVHAIRTAQLHTAVYLAAIDAGLRGEEDCKVHMKIGRRAREERRAKRRDEDGGGRGR